MNAPKMLGLGSFIVHVTDLDRAKRWYSDMLQLTPYFDEPFYVGFNVGGYELGLDPDCSAVRAGAGGAVAYWRVDNIMEAVTQFESHGARVIVAVESVGSAVKVATMADPDGNLIGLIENPGFAII